MPEFVKALLFFYGNSSLAEKHISLNELKCLAEVIGMIDERFPLLTKLSCMVLTTLEPLS